MTRHYQGAIAEEMMRMREVALKTDIRPLKKEIEQLGKKGIESLYHLHCILNRREYVGNTDMGNTRDDTNPYRQPIFNGQNPETD